MEMEGAGGHFQPFPDTKPLAVFTRAAVTYWRKLISGDIKPLIRVAALVTASLPMMPEKPSI
jgi:hypothetical protein